MEKKKYLSYNERIINRFAEYGFKRKNRDFFIRNLSEDVTQDLVIGHTTHGRTHVKYYQINANIRMPKVFKLGQEFGLYMRTAFYGSNIGELMPKPRPPILDWLIGEDTSEKYDNKMIDSMLYHVEKYAIPFLNKYCTPEAILEGIRKRAYPNGYGDEFHACIAFYLYGQKEDFLRFVEQRSYEMQFYDYGHEGHWDYKHPTEPLNRACKEFLDCAEKTELLFNKP